MPRLAPPPLSLESSSRLPDAPFGNSYTSAPRRLIFRHATTPQSVAHGKVGNGLPEAPRFDRDADQRNPKKGLDEVAKFAVIKTLRFWKTVPTSMGGQPQHPAWFLNREANPDVDVQFGQEHWRARAEALPFEQRSEVWPRITAAMPNFGEYQTKTSRLIPVVRLVRESSSNAGT